MMLSLNMKKRHMNISFYPRGSYFDMGTEKPNNLASDVSEVFQSSSHALGWRTHAASRHQPAAATRVHAGRDVILQDHRATPYAGSAAAVYKGRSHNTC